MAHLLLVEDNAAIGMALRRRLEVAGHIVTLIATSTQVAAAVQAQPPDLVLLATWLPGRDAVRVVQQLKAHLQTQDIPVILLTVRRDARALGAGGEKTADALLATRINVPDLLRTIAIMKVQAPVHPRWE